MQIVSGKLPTAERVVLCGVEGVGKSTLAAQFPGAVFMDLEGSTSHMDVHRLPTVTSWASSLEYVNALSKDHHGYDTLVVDTVDWLERLCAQHVCAANKVSSIEAFGYGKGFTYLKEEFGRYLDACSELVASGMHVVLVCHVQCRKFELPEESGAFDKWELKLSKTVAPLVKEWAYMLLFLNYKTYVIKDERTKSNKAQGSERTIYTTHAATHDAKNRHGLPDELPLSWDSIKHLFGVAPVSVPAARPAAPVSAPAEPVAHAMKPIDDMKALEKLQHLLVQCDITPDELMAVVAKRGFYPAGTPIEKLKDDFILGMLLPQWERVRWFVEEHKKGGMAT